MPTTFNWIFLGNIPTTLDPTEGNNVAENASLLVGNTYGSLADPLAAHVTSVTTLDLGGTAGALDQDNNASNDQFITDIGAGPTTYTFDSSVVYNATITYMNGTTATVTAVISQDTLGNLFLAPEFELNADTTAYENGPIRSIKFDSLFGDTYSGMNPNRVVTGFWDGYVDGTSGNDLINASYIEPSAGGKDRIDNNDALLPGSSGNDDYVRAGAGSDTVLAGSGNDTVYGGTGNDSIDGGAGNDLLYGEAGNDTLIGGTGNDTLDGGDGADIVQGGAGDDTFLLTGTFGNDTITGGETSESAGDIINASTWTANANVQFTGNEAGTFSDGTSTATFSEIERFAVGSGNDTINAAVTSTARTWDGGLGNDSIIAGSGNDTLLGGEGNDALFGGAGNDQQFGGNGNDTLDGGLGNDSLEGGAGNDSLSGGDGTDSLYGGDGFDTLDGGAGNDVLQGGAGDDTFRFTGTFGNDTITGGETSETLGDLIDATSLSTATTLNFTANEAGTLANSGSTTTFSEIERAILGSGNDTVNGTATTTGINVDAGAGNDSMTGGSGNDTMSGGDGNDALFGGAGVDQLFGGNGNDTLDGGTGNDSLNGGAGDDTFRLTGVFGNDTIVGGETGETLGDLIDGSALTANANVQFTGDELGTFSSGTSTASFSQIERVTVGSGNDTINASVTTTSLAFDGGAGNDSITAGSGDDTLLGGDGNDTLSGGGGNDSIDAGNGNDSIFGGDGTDLIYGGAGDDTIDGGERTDTIYGGAGNDYIYDTGTTASDDTIYGGDGNDTIAGGLREDLLDGGNDADTFILDGTFGNDTIIGGEGVTTGADFDTIDASALTTNTTLTFTGNEAGTLADGTSTATFSQIEQVKLGSGSDTVNASTATTGVNVDAGAGNDLLTGGSGSDTLSGGTGQDTISGGAGNDVISLGAGDGAADLLILQSGFGNDLVTGFEAPVDNGDGTYTGRDQLDVSSLLDTLGNPVNAWDVTVTDTNGDGTGDAILTFPNGESITLVGVLAANVDTAPELHAMGVPCFTRGTHILTQSGEVRVECLQVGDMVVTTDHGLQPIRWIGSRRVAAIGKLATVLIGKGVMGNHRDLRVSPQHRMLLSGWQTEVYFGETSVLVAAKHLVNEGDIRVVAGSEVEYFHILFDEHEIILAEGIETESFHPGDMAVSTLEADVKAELDALFPDFATNGVSAYGPTARRCLKAHEAALMQLFIVPKTGTSAFALSA